MHQMLRRVRLTEIFFVINFTKVFFQSIAKIQYETSSLRIFVLSGLVSISEATPHPTFGAFSMKGVCVMPQDMVRTEFGRDHGVIHEMVVTGRKVGAKEAFYSTIAHNEALFGRTVEFVTSGGGEIAKMPYQEIPAKRALQIVRHGYSHETVTKHTSWEYSPHLRRMQEVVRLPEVLLEQHAEDCVLVPMHQNANILAVRSLVEKKRKGSFYPQTWFDTEEFAKIAWADGWLLMPKGEVPGTRNLPRKEQIKPLVFGQAVPWAFERTFGVMLHYLDTDERLTSDVWLRCQDVASYGDRVRAGPFASGGFFVSRDPDGDCDPRIAGGAVWKC